MLKLVATLVLVVASRRPAPAAPPAASDPLEFYRGYLGVLATATSLEALLPYDLSVRVTVEIQQPVAADTQPDSPPAPPSRRDTINRRKVASGETMELSIPLSRPGPTLVLRVTPFF